MGTVKRSAATRNSSNSFRCQEDDHGQQEGGKLALDVLISRLASDDVYQRISPRLFVSSGVVVSSGRSL